MATQIENDQESVMRRYVALRNIAIDVLTKERFNFGNLKNSLDGISLRLNHAVVHVPGPETYGQVTISQTTPGQVEGLSYQARYNITQARKDGAYIPFGNNISGFRDITGDEMPEIERGFRSYMEKIVVPAITLGRLFTEED